MKHFHGSRSAQMQKRNIWPSTILLAVSLLIMGVGRSWAQGPGGGTLVAIRANTPPILDGRADDLTWVQATPLVVQAMNGGMGGGGYGQYTHVTLKAAYNESDLYILAQWNDATPSIDKKVWTYDGSNWSRANDEDRLAFLWNIDNSVANFSSWGCGATCHGWEGRMRTNGPAEFADQWQWKAARSNPMRAVDDQYLNDDYDATDMEAAHHGDGGDSTYVSNAGAGVPKWVWNSSTPSTPPGSTPDLATHFLLLSEATHFRSLNPLTGKAWVAGDQVPGYALRQTTGSRSDIEAYGTWDAGVWTVEMRRPLSTGEHALANGEKADVVFVPGQSYQFSIAVWDNADGIEHRRAPGPFTLVFRDGISGTPNPTATPVPTGTHGPMPTMTPMMTMTPMPTGTHGPMPTMTPMMTMTPMPTGTIPIPTMTPEVSDHIPPTGTILINNGTEIATSLFVTLTLSATDDPGGTGVAWMNIQEWGWDHNRGWHNVGHGSGGHHGWMGHWQPFTSTVQWMFSPEPGMRSIRVWFADAAWNVGPPATAMINLVTEGVSVRQGQGYQYRRTLQAGQRMTITLRSLTGDPDLYVWQPSNTGPPDWWSDQFTGDDRVTFVAPVEGVYLVEVHGYNDAMYDLHFGMGAATTTRLYSWSQSPPDLSLAVTQDKSLPQTPLVVGEPDASAPPPGFYVYLPAIIR